LIRDLTKPRAKILKAAKSLTEHTERLAEVGLFVGTRDRHMLMVGGVSAEPSSWRGFDIELQPVEHSQLADADGKPITDLTDGLSRLGAGRHSQHRGA
jgi:hypothetical protein